MRRLLSVFVAALVAALSFPALAQQLPCFPRADVLRHLGKKHGEVPVAMGLASNGGVIEVLSSPAGTWTMVISYPDGTTCLFAAGEDWQSMAREPALERS